MSFWDRTRRFARARARARIGGLASRAVLFACACACAVAARAARNDVSAGLTSGRLKVRLDAAQAVIEHRGSASPDDLVAASRRDANPEARARLLMAAYEVDIPRAIPALIAALRGDASPLVRSIAAQTLARAGGSAGAPARQAFHDGLAQDAALAVRRKCAAALGFHHSPDAVKALAAAASDPDPELRRGVGTALTLHPRSAETDRALDALENDRDPSVAGRVRARRRAARGPSK